ncbi:MAG: peptidoglycan DD-metalloendopeptidase family protein [Bacteroidota bacterium]
MKQCACRILILTTMVCLTIVSFAQTSPTAQRQALETKRKELLEKIKEAKQVLAETRQKKNTTVTQLKAITSQIKTRERVINNVQEQISVLGQQIEESRDSLNKLKADLEKLKADYAKSILSAYKSRNVYDKMMFVFSAESFNQALKRIQYLNQYSDYRQRQAALILSTQNEIITALNQMLAKKQEKMALIGMKESEKKELEQDKQEENKVLVSLQQQEKEVRKQLAESQAAARKLNRAIEEMIAREIEEARRKEEARRREEAARNAAAGKSSPTKPEPAKPTKVESDLFLTPEVLKMSNDFEQNKNNLPWPVERGYIAEAFGTHAHPTLRGVQVNNNGVDISTQPNANVRAVFKGKVTKIFNVPGMGKIVLISHGKYFTAYARLASTTVHEGQVVDSKQTIGVVDTNEDGVTEVQFQIWNMDKKLDPEVWLKN